MSENQQPSIVKFFFPPFSELDLVSLFYLLFLTSIHRWESLLALAFQSGRLFVIGLLTIPVAFMVFLNAVSYRAISDVEKQIFAIWFYILLSIITIYSLLNSYSTTTSSGNSVLSTLEFIIFIYLFLKSVSRLILMRYARKQIIEDMGNQMRDNQTRALELVLVILLSPVIYLLINPNNTPTQTICLSYFYLTLLVKNIYKIFGKHLTIE